MRLISRLESIEECIDTSGMQCMPATTFDWGEQCHWRPALRVCAIVMQLAGTDQGVSAIPLLDFNGDGLKDVAWMKAYAGWRIRPKILLRKKSYRHRFCV